MWLFSFRVTCTHWPRLSSKPVMLSITRLMPRIPAQFKKSRPTLRGLAGHYAHLTDISRERVERTLVEAGFHLGAVIEFDPADSAGEADLPRSERRITCPEKRPRIARLDQVRISRDGEDAIIEFHDPEIAVTHLRIGPQSKDD